MAIVRRIVELHGGTVQIASRPGQGTRVVMHFARGNVECYQAGHGSPS